MASQSSETRSLNAMIAMIAITTSTPTRIAYSVVPWPDLSASASRRATLTLSPPMASPLSPLRT